MLVRLTIVINVNYSWILLAQVWMTVLGEVGWNIQNIVKYRTIFFCQNGKILLVDSEDLIRLTVKVYPFFLNLMATRYKNYNISLCFRTRTTRRETIPLEKKNNKQKLTPRQTTHAYQTPIFNSLWHQLLYCTYTYASFKRLKLAWLVYNKIYLHYLAPE